MSWEQRITRAEMDAAHRVSIESFQVALRGLVRRGGTVHRYDDPVTGETVFRGTGKVSVFQGCIGTLREVSEPKA